jgi:lipoyl(octanoyl) transferase
VRWHLIVDPHPRTGSDNMRADYALMQSARGGDGFLRLYRWDPPCLSFGRNESTRRRYNTAAIEALGIDTVRRPTGGRAVWHDRELTYAVAAPIRTFGSLAETYRSIHVMLAAALDRLGASVSLATAPRTRPTLAGGSCFASPAGGEIVCNGRKLVGSAQVREGSAFLQHGSILLENDQDMVSRISIDPSEHPCATSLSETIDRSVTADEVAAAVAETARSFWSGEWVAAVAAPVPSVPVPAGTIDFQDTTWTWRR